MGDMDGSRLIVASVWFLGDKQHHLASCHTFRKVHLWCKCGSRSVGRTVGLWKQPNKCANRTDIEILANFMGLAFNFYFHAENALRSIDTPIHSDTAFDLCRTAVRVYANRWLANYSTKDIANDCVCLVGFSFFASIIPIGVCDCVEGYEKNHGATGISKREKYRNEKEIQTKRLIFYADRNCVRWRFAAARLGMLNHKRTKIEQNRSPLSWYTILCMCTYATVTKPHQFS